MKRPLLTCWIALGFIFCAGVGAQVLRSNVPWKSDGAAAWVQAVGSIAAIGAAIAIAGWQGHQMRAEQRAAARKREIVKLEATYAAISEAVAAACKIYDDFEQQSLPFDAIGPAVMLDEALTSIKALPAADAPHPAAVVALSLAKLQVSQLIPRLKIFAEHSEVEHFSPEQIEFAKARAERLIELANDVARLLPEEHQPDMMTLHKAMASRRAGRAD